MKRQDGTWLVTVANNKKRDCIDIDLGFAVLVSFLSRCIDRCRWVLGNVSLPYRATCTVWLLVHQMTPSLTIWRSSPRAYRQLGATRQDALRGLQTDRFPSLLPFLHTLYTSYPIRKSISSHTLKPKIGVGRESYWEEERRWTWSWDWESGEARADESREKASIQNGRYYRTSQR